MSKVHVFVWRARKFGGIRVIAGLQLMGKRKDTRTVTTQVGLKPTR